MNQPIRYVSTRGSAPEASFEDVLFGGLAPDGGLYVPASWPHFEPEAFEALQGRPYPEVAATILAPFVGPALQPPTFRAILDEAYATFAHSSIAPLRELAPNRWLMELFHGPTLAFKDVALQLLSRLFEHFLKQRQQAITIIGATSGDTGAAAIGACAGRERMRIVILHPHERISAVQRRQMTTVPDANVHNIALEGTFDDCQAIVKAMFNDPAIRADLRLAAINSINWVRVAAQAVYYVTAALALGAPWRKAAFCVPTGNFGDVYAGWVAARTGLPMARLIVATNRNDILARFFATGIYEAGEVHPTISPSMDIQVASNFERLLFDLDPAHVRGHMTAFQDTGRFEVDQDALGRARELFDAARADESETGAAMAAVLEETGLLVDPHTAVGLHAARQFDDPTVPLVTLATASPAKFPDAVRTCTGITPAPPERLGTLFDRPERFVVLPNDLRAVTREVRAFAAGTF